MPRIVFKNNEHPAVDLTGPVTVGRSAQHANVVVKDNRLSRAHCKYEPRDDGTWVVMDLESQNGTFVNGRRIRESMVKAGDVVTIGACDMMFEGTGAGAKTVMQGVQSTRGTAATSSLDLSDQSLAKATPERADSTRTVVAPAALILIKGSLADKIHPITHDPFNIGRKSDNHLVLDGDGKSSGHHARITRDGLQFLIEDLGSTNGVTVNGTRITGKVVLKTGMKVIVGTQLFKFEMQGKPALSSGATAPEMARDEVQRRLSSPDAAGDAADLEDPGHSPTVIAPAGQGVGEASEAELEAADDEDRAALSQQIKFKGSGSTVFTIIEVVVVLAVAAAVLFAAWTMLKDDPSSGSTGEDGFPMARDGGLLKKNPSFDERDDGGFAVGWRYLISGTDSFNLVEGARGGRYAMQISRFNSANEASFVMTETMEVPGAGVDVSVFALNADAGNNRFGSALVSVFWFAHPRDREPMLVSPVTARTRMTEWTELKGSAVAPPGAKAFAVGFGIMGLPGIVSYDDVSISASSAPEGRLKAASMQFGGGTGWVVSPAGGFTLNGPDGELLRDARVLLHQSENRLDPLDPLFTMTAPLEVNETASALALKYKYFDPMAELEMLLSLQLGIQDGKPQILASVGPAAGGDASKASRYIGISVLLTGTFAPAELVRLRKGSEQPEEFRHDIGAGGNATFHTLLAANTGTGNMILALGDTTPLVRVQRVATGRELFVQHANRLQLGIGIGTGMSELEQRVSLIAQVQPGETQIERINRAVSIFADFPFNQPQLVLAADAIDSAAKYYRLRLIELRDGVNVPQLSRNEQLYRSAMREAIETAELLRNQKQPWDETSLPVLRKAGSDGMSERCKQASAVARDAMRQLVEVVNDFVALDAVARKQLFLLEVEIEQRDSENYLVSARDFLDSGQVIQGMLKLQRVISAYPRCLRGIEAKERAVEVAALMLDEVDAFKKQGLQNIARDRAVMARDLLDLIDSKLLAKILNAEQKGWLRDVDVSGDTLPTLWLQRDSAIGSKIATLRLKLPSDLPPKGQ